jgi:hypothetical protein
MWGWVWMVMFQMPGLAVGSESLEVEVVKTSPAYGEEVQNLKDLMITIRFNREMDPSIQEDFLLDQRGATDTQGNPVEITGQFTWPDSKTLQFKPKGALKPKSTYQISLFSVRTQDGEEMEDVPFRLVFTTGSGKQ